MNYLREFLYRPKRSDRSLMARFFYADENLTAVAQELDSFDGRKDPERCASLVNKLRSCQDKLLSICNKMLEEVEPGYSGRLREHRAKFPDDIMTDNLAGQLWFGAECLAAGSSIMNKESESEAMRPLAKAVTKSLEKVRSLLREQVLSINQDYTEKIRENLKIFDRLFADFEYNYVSCMVHVKSVKEYDLHQDLIVLFSDTLTRALKQEMVSQEVVDNYDPSLMFAIPRLAIVYGLLICTEGPLNVDRSHTDFPSLFLPFKNLLRKIRELLQTLEPNEVMVLEMLLCQLEEPANIATKLKEVERMLENKEKSEGQVLRLQAKLSGEQEPSKIQRLNSIPCQCDTNSSSSSNSQTEQIVRELLRDMVDDAVNRASSVTSASQSRQRPVSSVSSQSAAVEIDCTHPEIRVSPAHRRTVEIDIIPAANTSSESPNTVQQVPSSTASSESVTQRVIKIQRKNTHSTETEATVPARGCTSAPIDFKSSRSSSSSLKRHNARRDTKRVPYKFQKDRRAKFKSTEDLIHRLYVCISGAADQLQSNYAADFRSILRVVFTINVSQDDDDIPDTSGCIPGQNPDLSPTDPENPYNPETTSTTDLEEDISNSTPPPEGAEQPEVAARNRKLDENTGSDETDGAAALEENPMPKLHEVLAGAQGSMDYGTDALQNDMSASLYNLTLTSEDSNDDEASETRGLGVYAQNIDLHLHAEDGTETPGALNLDGHSNNAFFQPEPALLDIADGTNSSNLPQEIVASDNTFYRINQNPTRQPPPSWIPDTEAPNCMGCHDQFTFVKRRHHCRACGKVFCSKCSSQFMPLPQFGLDRPVRVCNRCDLLMNGDQHPFSNLATSPGSNHSSEVLDASSENSSNPRSPTQWNRYYGMVS